MMNMEFVQDMDTAVSIMREAGTWMLENGKNPSMWWRLENLNRNFLLQHAKPNEFYVLKVNGKPAASVVLQIDDDYKDWRSIDEHNSQLALYINWLCVAREFAGKNLPKKLIDFAIDMAKRNKLNFVRLDTNAEEPKLMGLYEDMNFELVKIVEDYRKSAFFQKRI